MPAFIHHPLSSGRNPITPAYYNAVQLFHRIPEPVKLRLSFGLPSSWTFPGYLPSGQPPINCLGRRLHVASSEGLTWALANSHLRDITPSRVSSPDTPVESRLYVFPSPALPRTRHVLRLHIHTTAAEVLFFYSSGIRSPDLQIHSFQHQAPAATHVAILGHINCISTPQPHVFHDIASNLRRQHVLCYFLFFILSSALVSPQLGTLPSLLGSTMTTGFFFPFLRMQWNLLVPHFTSFTRDRWIRS